MIDEIVIVLYHDTGDTPDTPYAMCGADIKSRPPFFLVMFIYGAPPNNNDIFDCYT